MRKTASGVSCLAFSLLLGTLAAVPSANCDALFIQNPLPQQVTDVTQQIQTDPSAENYSRRAEELRRLGMRKEALDDINQALTMEPVNVATNVLRGRVYFEDGMFPEAVANLGQAIKIDPKFAGSYELRARAYLRMKEYSKALDDANTVLQDDPTNANGLLLRGAAYNGLRKYSNAIDDLTAALKLNSKLDKAYYWRAEAYQNSGDYQKSVDDYVQAVKLQPEYRPALVGLAYSYYKLGKDDEALKVLRDAIDFHDTIDLKAVNSFEGKKATDTNGVPDPEYNLGMLIEEDLNQAMVLFDDILKDKPGDPTALRERGVALMHLSKYRDAARDLNAAMKGLPLNPDGFSGLGSQDAYNAAVPLYKKGNQQLSDGDFDAAIESYQAALKLYPQYGRCWHNLAIAYSAQRDNFTAELCAVQSVSYRPSDWKLWHTLGATLFAEYKQDKGDPKKLDAAVSALNQSLSLNPDTDADKESIRHLLASVKAYERSLTPVINFQITTMPIN